MISGCWLRFEDYSNNSLVTIIVPRAMIAWHWRPVFSLVIYQVMLMCYSVMKFNRDAETVRGWTSLVTGLPGPLRTQLLLEQHLLSVLDQYLGLRQLVALGPLLLRWIQSFLSKIYGCYITGARICIDSCIRVSTSHERSCGK
jgi:hypothetical protein